MIPKVHAGKPRVHARKMAVLLMLTLLVSIPVFGQGGFIKKYQSPPGFTETRGGTELGFEDHMDFDGDGKPDLVLERVNEQGVRIELFVVDPEDLEVPGQPYTFGVLKRAQALGDMETLRRRGRRVVRLHLSSDVEAGLDRVAQALRSAVTSVIARS